MALGRLKVPGPNFAAEMKTTKRPSALNIGLNEASFPCVPSSATETRTVEGVQSDETPAHVSRTKISSATLVSPGTKLVAPDAKAMYRPSALIEKSSANVPSPATETDVVAGVHSEGAPVHISSG
jgi:hypothetical protein